MYHFLTFTCGLHPYTYMDLDCMGTLGEILTWRHIRRKCPRQTAQRAARGQPVGSERGQSVHSVDREQSRRRAVWRNSRSNVVPQAAECGEVRARRPHSGRPATGRHPQIPYIPHRDLLHSGFITADGFRQTVRIQLPRGLVAGRAGGLGGRALRRGGETRARCRRQALHRPTHRQRHLAHGLPPRPDRRRRRAGTQQVAAQLRAHRDVVSINLNFIEIKLMYHNNF